MMSNEIRFVRVGDRIINVSLVTNVVFYSTTDGTETTLVIHFSGENAMALSGAEAEAFWRLLSASALKVALEKANAEG